MLFVVAPLSFEENQSSVLVLVGQSYCLDLDQRSFIYRAFVYTLFVVTVPSIRLILMVST